MYMCIGDYSEHVLLCCLFVLFCFLIKMNNIDLKINK